MAGRAGRRKGGEVFVAERSDAMRRVVSLMEGALPPVRSALTPAGRSLARPIMEAIAVGVATSEANLRKYVAVSLVGKQSDVASLRRNVCRSIGYLQHHDAIRCVEFRGNIVIQATRLGRAMAISSLPLEESVLVYRDLFLHRTAVCLRSTLFLAFLITPFFGIPAFSWSRLESVVLSFSFQIVDATPHSR